MIDHQNKIIFIHINKCGGTSIDQFFAGSMQRHSCIRDYEDQLGLKELNLYFKFTTVRNPWDKAVSYYHWIRKLINNSNQNVIRAYGADWDFKKFIKTKLDVRCAGGTKYANAWLACNQLNWIKNSKNQICIDYICRFENLQQDFNIVCDKIGIPRQKLPHSNKGKYKHKHHTEYYDEETREIIACRHAEDIEYFGYKFGE